MLGEYDQVVPGMARELIDANREQRHHRMKLEARSVNHNIIQAYVGQASALGVTIAALTFGYRIVVLGYDVADFFLGFSGIASLVAVFIYGKRQQRRDLRDKEPPSKEIEKQD